MSVEPLPVLGREDPLESFYAPAFSLKILNRSDAPRVVVVEGDVGRDVLYDVESVTYVDNVEEADSFSLTINNWDALGRRPKYVGYREKPTKDPQTTWSTLFDPGQRFELSLGYRAKGNQRLMMRGHVAGFDVTFPQNGPITLKVEAQDAARKLGEETFSWRWSDKRDSEIAKQLADKPAKGRPGINFPIETSAQATSMEARHPRVVMRRKSVMAFLLERARRHCYSVFRQVKDGEEVLYFGPSELLPEGPYTLEWGKTLLEFHPTLKVAKQAKQATVRAWDRGSGKTISHTAKLADFELNADLHPYVEALGEKKEVVDRALRTRDEVEELARSTMLCSLKSLVEATGATVGLPDLRAGQVCRITGVDHRFNGRYFLLQTTHTLDANGYRTTFRARREEPVR